jgi:hypothetical protein
MSLTDAQLIVIRSNITNSTDPAVVAARGNGADIGRDDTTLSAIYSAPSSPAVIVWRTAVPRIDAQAEGFDWTQVDNLTTGQARIWFDALFGDGFVNAADAGQRAGIAEAWKGTAPKVAVATFVLGKCKRTANRVEALFATGAGTSLSPSLLVYEGGIGQSELGMAFALPG